MELDLNLPYQVKKVEKIENDIINFSIVIITRNNENHLQELLNSLNEYKERGGEILVFDINSTDKTLDIAKNWGCKIENGENFFRIIDQDMSDIINEKFKRDENNIINNGDIYIDYASARDYASSLTNNDMILMLDPNSRIINFNINEIITFINNGFVYLDFIIHNKQNTIFGFYNKRIYGWRNLIDEKLHLYEEQKQTGTLPDNILSVEVLEKRKEDDDYFISLTVESFLNYGNNEMMKKFANKLLEKKLYNSSLNIFENYLSRNNISEIELSKTYLSIGDVFMNTSREKEAIEYYHKSYIEYSKWRTPLYKIAEHFFLKGIWDKAIFYAQGCLNIERPEIDMNENELYYQDGPYSILYVSHWWLGNPEKGKYYFDKALEINPRKELYISEANYHYKYKGNIIDGSLTFKEIQYLYDISKKYETILEIGSEQGRGTHALIADNPNLITILNKNIDINNIRTNLDNPGNIRFVDENNIDNEKFDLIIINCANISHDELKTIIQKYQFNALKMIIGYNYNDNKDAVNESLEISGIYENIWYKKISKFEKKTIYIKKEI